MIRKITSPHPRPVVRNARASSIGEKVPKVSSPITLRMTSRKNAMSGSTRIRLSAGSGTCACTASAHRPTSQRRHVLRALRVSAVNTTAGACQRAALSTSGRPSRTLARAISHSLIRSGCCWTRTISAGSSKRNTTAPSTLPTGRANPPAMTTCRSSNFTPSSPCLSNAYRPAVSAVFTSRRCASRTRVRLLLTNCWR